MTRRHPGRLVALCVLLSGCFDDLGTTTSTSAEATSDASQASGSTVETAGDTTGAQTQGTTEPETTGAALSCGDGVVSPELGEACDDGEDNGALCCGERCELLHRARTVVAGEQHSCLAMCDGSVRCWGAGASGALGDGTTNVWGDEDWETIVDKTPLGFLDDAQQPTAVVQLALGYAFTCARLASGGVRCWGRNDNGQLGYPGIGTQKTSPGGDVRIGGPALEIAVGSAHACALLEGGAVRCWGDGDNGPTGLGLLGDIGDDEPPDEVPLVPLDQPVVTLTAGAYHTCAALEDGSARCWGRGDSGQLGHGMGGAIIGDDESPLAVPALEFSAPVTRLWGGRTTTCALLASDMTYCWGRNERGELGLGHTNRIGDDESATSTVAEVPLGDVAPRSLSLEEFLHCAVIGDGTGAIRCLGGVDYGGLGTGAIDEACYANNFGCLAPHCCFGDDADELPLTQGFPLELEFREVSVGRRHACALTTDHELLCWGSRQDGRLAGGPLPDECSDAALGPFCARHPDCCLGDDEPVTRERAALDY